MKKIVNYSGLFLGLLMFVGCSEKDEPLPAPGGVEPPAEEAAYVLPSSIIEDTRISVMKGFLRPTLQINCQEDGAPKYALYESTDFRFSYIEQGGRLVLSEIEHSGSVNTFTVSDITFNPDGFVTGMTETNRAKTTTGEYAGKETVEKAREFDPFGHAGFDPSGIIRLTP